MALPSLSCPQKKLTFGPSWATGSVGETVGLVVGFVDGVNDGPTLGSVVGEFVTWGSGVSLVTQNTANAVIRARTTSITRPRQNLRRSFFGAGGILTGGRVTTDRRTSGRLTATVITFLSALLCSQRTDKELFLAPLYHSPPFFKGRFLGPKNELSPL